MTEAEGWRSLVTPCLQKVMRWELSKRELRLAEWIIVHSYGEGRGWVRVRDQARLALLTRMDEAHVSTTLRKLKKGGVLQQERQKLADGSQVLVLTWLPNASLVAPQERAVDAAALAVALDEHEWLNAAAANAEPLGRGLEQPRLALVTMDERINAELARGSQEECGGSLDAWAAPGSGASSQAVIEGGAEWWAEQARESMRSVERRQELPNRQFQRAGPELEIADSASFAAADRADTDACARAGRNVHTFKATTLRDVGSVPGRREQMSASPGDHDVSRALEKIQGALTEAEWRDFRRWWTKNCQEAPLQVIGAVDDGRAYVNRNRPAKSLGAIIGARFKELLREAGRAMKCIFW